MKAYQEIRDRYQKRQSHTMMDVIMTGLTFMYDHRAEAVLPAGNMLGMLPYAAIAVQEGRKAVLRLKPLPNAVQDAVIRMSKTSISLALGMSVAGKAGKWAAIMVAMAIRIFCDRCRPRGLTDRRIKGRIARLRQLNVQLRQAQVGTVIVTTKAAQIQTVFHKG